MKIESLLAPVKALLVTVSQGVAFCLTAALALHYLGTARILNAENAQLKDQMQILVERLAEIEGSMVRVASERRAVDQSSLDGLSTVLERAGIAPDREAKIERSLEPVATGSVLERVRGGTSFVALLDRFAVARSNAGKLAADLASTSEVVASRSAIMRALPGIMPAKGSVSSEFGIRESPFHPGFAGMHHGIDVAATEGSNVVATADGVVGFAGNNGSFGKFITINHGFGISTRYGHNAQLLVKKGALVVRGQTIATVGNTGRSTGAHVHYEISLYDKPVDPRRFLFNATPEETAPPATSLAHLALGGEALTAPLAHLTLNGDTASELNNLIENAADQRPRLGVEWDAPLSSLPPQLTNGASTGSVAIAILLCLLFSIACSVMRMPRLSLAGVVGTSPLAERSLTAVELVREFHRKQRASSSRWAQFKATFWGG